MMPTASTPRGEDYDPVDDEPGMRLAEQLKRAWISAGRPRMSDVGDAVGYNKASISKVLSGKMPPAWHLVRKLGAALGVPEDIVRTEWHPLWVAADELRRQRQVEPMAPAGRQQCVLCGSWVADPAVHSLWHGRVDVVPPNRPDAHRWASLRDALPRRNEGGGNGRDGLLGNRRED
jgi:transcriptional regulator with XRE-family HTH domain